MCHMVGVWHSKNNLTVDNKLSNFTKRKRFKICQSIVFAVDFYVACLLLIHAVHFTYFMEHKNTMKLKTHKENVASQV